MIFLFSLKFASRAPHGLILSRVGAAVLARVFAYLRRCVLACRFLMLCSLCWLLGEGVHGGGGDGCVVCVVAHPLSPDLCGEVGAGDGEAAVADPGADAVGVEVVAGAVVVADAAVEDGSGGELVDVGVFPFAAGGVVDARDGGHLGRAVVTCSAVAVAALVGGLAAGALVALCACALSRRVAFFRAGGGCAAGRVRRGCGCADVIVDFARLLGGACRCLGGVVGERVVRFLSCEGGEEFVCDGGCRVDAVVLVVHGVFFFLARVACVCFLARAASGDAGGDCDSCPLGAL